MQFGKYPHKNAVNFFLNSKLTRHLSFNLKYQTRPQITKLPTTDEFLQVNLRLILLSLEPLSRALVISLVLLTSLII